MSSTITFTPEAVKTVLLGVGFDEVAPHLAGFYVKAYPSTIFVTWDAGPHSTQTAVMHDGYRTALAKAGYRAYVNAGYVAVTGLQEG